MDKEKGIILSSVLALCVAIAAPLFSATQTPNEGYNKWETGDTDYVQQQNDNWDAIDADITEIKQSTGSLNLDSLSESTAALSASTISLQGQVDALGISTGVMQIEIDALGASTDAIAGSISTFQPQIDALGISTDALAVSTGNIQVQTDLQQVEIDALSVSTNALAISTGAIQTQVDMLLSEVSDDLTPQLGGDLDGQDFALLNISTADINGELNVGGQLDVSSDAFVVGVFSAEAVGDDTYSIEASSGIRIDGTSGGGVQFGDGSVMYTAVFGGSLFNVVDDLTPQLGGDLDGLDNQILNISTITTNGKVVGQIDGTNAAPTFTFSGDEDTGMYRESANTISLSAGGSSILTVQNTGGTGGIFANRGIEIDNSGSANPIDFLVNTDTFTITNGRAGMGTTDPQETLDVRGNIVSDSSISASGFFGDGAGLVNTVRLDFLYLPIPTTIAVSTFVAVSTITATHRGNRPVDGSCTATINNSAGTSKLYTLRVMKDGLDVSGEWERSVRSGDEGNATIPWVEALSSAGIKEYKLEVMTSNTSGTQTVDDRICKVREY